MITPITHLVLELGKEIDLDFLNLANLLFLAHNLSMFLIFIRYFCKKITIGLIVTEAKDEEESWHTLLDEGVCEWTFSYYFFNESFYDSLLPVVFEENMKNIS